MQMHWPIVITRREMEYVAAIIVRDLDNSSVFPEMGAGVAARNTVTLRAGGRGTGTLAVSWSGGGLRLAGNRGGGWSVGVGAREEDVSLTGEEIPLSPEKASVLE